MSVATGQAAPQRITVTETQMVLDIIANTDTVPPTEVVAELIKQSNKWRYQNVAVSVAGTIQSIERDHKDGDAASWIGADHKPCFVIVNEDGIVPPPWSESLISAIKASYEIYSLDWLTGG